MHRLTLPLALVLTLPFLARAEPTTSQFLMRSLTSDAGTTPYRLYVPPEYDGGTALPLVVFLHGSGERGTNNTAQLASNCQGAFDLISDAHRAVQPMFMMAPQSPGDWSQAPSATNVSLVVNQLLGSYAIDPSRVYLTGISMGGAGTWYHLQATPQLWAAGIPMSGWGAGNSGAIKDIPVWNFHAANDGTVGVAGSDNAVGGLRNAGGVQVVYTRYNTGGHGIWSQAYRTPLLHPWLIAHRKTGIAHRPPAMFVDTVSVANVAGARQVSATGRVEDSTIGLTSVEVKRASGASAVVTGTASWSSTGIAFSTNTTQYLIAQAHLSNFHATWGGESTASTSVPIVIPSGSTDYTAPAVAITAPTTSATYTTNQPTVALSGTASDNVGVTRVWWENDRGGSADATGTTAWTISAVPLVPGLNVISVHARDAMGNIVTALLTVTATTPTADTTAPAITITSPTSMSTFATTSATVSLTGTASDNVGVTSVTWVNDRGGAGNATGTTSWTASNIALSTGLNVLTLVARDAPGNMAIDTLTVTRNAATFALTVDGGTGSGNYASGAVVAVSANAPPSGKVFDAWVGNVSAVANPTSASTTVTMPASAVTIASTYKTLPPQAPTIATAAQASPSQVTGTTTTLSVLGADVTGEATLKYQWSGPTGVSFSANGTNAAKSVTATFSAPGTYVVTVTVTNGAGLTVISQVTVTVTRALARVVVVPSVATVEVGQVRTFTAEGYDQFNAPFTPSAVQWSTSGGGTIDASGAFTADASPGGPFTITASSTGRSGTAQVTVSALPGDLTPPVVVLTAPADGEHVAPATTLRATATDDVAVASVRFEVDGVMLGEVATAPYELAISALEPGTHVATAVAFDTAGNQGGSDDVAFVVDLLDGGVFDAGVVVEEPDAGAEPSPEDAGVAPSDDAGVEGDVDAGSSDGEVENPPMPKRTVLGGCGGCSAGFDLSFIGIAALLALLKPRRRSGQSRNRWS